MNKQQEDEETKRTAIRSSFGHMELKRSSKAEPRGKRNLDAMRLAEARQEEAELSEMLCYF